MLSRLLLTTWKLTLSEAKLHLWLWLCSNATLRSLPSLCEIITSSQRVHPVMWISEIKISQIKVDSKLSHMSKSNVRLFVSIYYGAKRGKSKPGEAEFGHYENTRLWFMFDEINIGTRSDAIKYFYLEPLKPFLFVCVPLDKCVHLNLFDLLDN